MAPTVILIRHAEGLHNLHDKLKRHKKLFRMMNLHFPHDIHMRDPVLSKNGRMQCVELQRHLRTSLPLANQVELIVASPLRRTLQTAQLSLTWLVHRGIPIIPMAEWQEYSHKPCDTGTDCSILSEEFPTIDFSTVHPDWPSKKGYWAWTQHDVLQRGVDCRAWLKSRPEKVIAVVSHASFMRTSIANAKFGNADYRILDFHSNDPSNLDMIEWAVTASKGGGMARSVKGWRGIEPGDFPYD